MPEGGRRALALSLAIFVLASAGTAAAQVTAKPSRAAFERCKWVRFSDAGVGLAAWVQRCDYGDRKIDFVPQGRSLAVRFSDGGAKPDPVIDIFDLKPGEAPADGVRRIFAEHTDPAVAKRCALAPFRDGKPPLGAQRLTFVPNAAYAKELKKTAKPDEIPDPACGDWGDAPDGIQYFLIWPKSTAGRIAFVRIGQDEPLFDERTLQPLPPSR